MGVSFGLVAGAVSAQPGIHEGDIALGVDVDRLGVSDGTVDLDTGNFIFDECAFGVELDINARTSDPGFDTELGVFPTNAAIGYFYRSALREWDGQTFDTISDERLRMSFGPVSGVSTPLEDPAEPVEGFFVGVNSDGEFHRHFTFRLELDGSPATNLASQGVFLAELELRIDSGLYLPTEPFWLIFDNGADSSEVEAAVDYVRTTIGGCGEAPCLADVNGDGLVSPADFTSWVLAFNTGGAGCDQNGDGLCAPADFTSWILNFNTGCN
ncbi:MAG: hypothetical protein AAFR96_04525 [Planctomycetota bacterium]